ncbi:SDR family oxidoreductase [Chryseomicrobium sp. FSL W7-1435]|uniref:SDR family NAD(P)-dependent oxidoreductase n=1 Tax=Chryseomicrobium sp. FSL W7-1435 TaxID=2921704 RepID=UPI00315B2EC8
MRFSDKVVVVNGGTSGIGAEVVKQFVKEGAVVYFSGRSEEKAAQVESDNAHFIAVDNHEPEQIDAFFKEVLKQEERIDILFNNAGVLSVATGPLSRVKLDKWHELIAVNQTAIFLYMQNTLQVMSKQKTGVIINNAAILGGAKINPMLPAYSGTKAAVIAMTKSAALRHASEGIRINSISPGPTETDLAVRAYGSQRAFDENSSHHPRGRYAKPDEIAPAVLFLASSEASYINGTDLVVDGGYSLK